MARRLERTHAGVKAVVREVRREDVTFMAASIAYHAFVSMLPILLLLILVLSAFGSDSLDATVTGVTKAMLPASGQEAVTEALRGATASVGLSVAGVGVLLWGTSKIFRAMDAAFAELYDTERNLSLVDQFRDALVVFLALVIAAVGTVLLGSVFEVPETVPFAWALDALAAILGLAVAFFPLYYVFPNLDVSLREVVPGVLVAAVGWVGLKSLFNLYVSVSSKPDVYGLIGTLVLLVTWLYVGGLVLLVGGAVNATLAGRGGDRTGGRQEKRQFGRQVTDADSFENRIDELVEEADDADVADERLRRILRRKAEVVDGTDGERETGDGETAA
jgi:membrane protein